MPTLISSGPCGWKKWGIMKLRQKCNFLGLDDSGKRDATMRTLRDYYSSLPKRITDSDNPWLRDDVEDIIGDRSDTESSIMKWTVMDNWSGIDNLPTSPVSLSPPPSSKSSVTSSTSLNSSITHQPISPTTPMQQPLSPNMQLTSAPISFTPVPIRLSGVLNEIPFDIISESNSDTNFPQSTWEPHTKNRPVICYNDNYVNKMKSPKTVPGRKTYAQVTDTVKTTSIVGDSTIRSINQRFFNRFIDQSKERARIYKYPGATAGMVNHYVKYTLEHDMPHQIIVCAGTNDILSDREHADPSIIANRVADIARTCKTEGVNSVHISALMPMCSNRYQHIFRSVNNILKTICWEEGFIYIPHNNMYGRADLHADRLHLNINGTNKYIGDLLSHMESYNPYLYPEPPYHSTRYY